MLKADFDRYLLDLATQEKKAGECDDCGIEIYEGQEVLICNDGEMFCDRDCFASYTEKVFNPICVSAKEEY